MKRFNLIILCLLVLFLFSSCGDGKIPIPCSSDSYIGQNYNTVISELKNIGFSSVEVNIIDDLTSKNTLDDGYVESVTIDGLSQFKAKDKFLPDSHIIVTYHIIPKLEIPIHNDDIQLFSYSELAEKFVQTGFTNVTTMEQYDIDPDTFSADYQNELILEEHYSLSETEELPFDAPVLIIGHFPYTKYNINISIDFVSNLLFSRYDVSLYANDEKIGEMSHGTDAEYSLRFKEGEYTLLFQNTMTSNVTGQVKLDVNSDIEASYKIYCYSDKITVDTIFVDHLNSLADDEVKILCTESNFTSSYVNDVVKYLSDLGFTNIKTVPQYDIIWGITESESVQSVTIDGLRKYKRGDIFKKDAEIIVTYHMPYEDSPERIAEREQKEKEQLQYGEDSAVENDDNLYEGMEYTPLDKDLVITMCERDKKYTTMYNIVFTEFSSDGTPIAFYTFDNCINPRQMGKEFNAIGELPSWFYVGATVHVQAKIITNHLLDCTVTEPTSSASSTSFSDNQEMPVMKGVTVDKVMKTASEYGVSIPLFPDVDFGHGTMHKELKNKSDGINLELTYSSKTREILCASIVTFNLNSTAQEQKEFVSAIAKVCCPDEDKDAVSRWIDTNIGKKSSTIINGFDYEVFLGPSKNICYLAGESRWAEWDASVN